MAHVVVPATEAAFEISVGSTPSTGPFTVPASFILFDQEDLRIRVGDTELTQAQFTFSGTYDGGYAGGSITLATAASDTTIYGWRDTVRGRSADFPEGAPVTRAVLNTEFDRIAAQIVDLDARLKRTLRIADWMPELGLVSDPDDVIFTVAKNASFTPDVDTDGFYDGVSGAGFFADYNCLGGVAWRPDLSASQASISGGGIRDGFAVLARDTDTTDYTAIGRKISNGARILMTGAYDADTDTWGAQAGKDVIGLDVHAIANVTDPNRGVSGIAAGSINYGTGIISHEFSVENPAAGSQSLSMAAVQGIIRPYNAADDGSHVYQAFLATNTGHRVTAGLRLTSTPISGSYNGRFRYGVDMTPASIEECALRLRGTSAVGHAATVIEYDANDYSYYDRANDRYAFVVGGSARLFINSSGLNFSGFTGNAILEYDGNDYTFYDKTNNRLNTVIAGSTVASQNAVGLGLGGIIGVSGTFLSLPASTTALAHFRALDGVAPSSPVNGDVWFEGDTMKRRIGGVTKTLTFT